MDVSSELDHSYPSIEHPKSIIHLDVDYFYAQVEEIIHPELKGKPLGIKQKNLVVTSNYEARKYGVKKCMSVYEALRVCKNLTLVCGEDLTPYRRMSAKITEILHQFTNLVERLGLDENYIDVTSLVQKNIKSTVDDLNASKTDNTSLGENTLSENLKSIDSIGNIYSKPEEDCPCGCHNRLAIASKIAVDIRNKIKNELGLTCSAGIAHNKLLSKLVGALNKPNQQTLIYPFSAANFMSTLGSFSKIPGIGRRTAESLTANNILCIEDIRRVSLESLQVKIGKELARKIKEYVEGIDDSPVKPSGRPQSIGLEDGFKQVSLIGEVESRLGALLRRLIESATEDGRIPLCMKLTVRKQDTLNKSNNSGKRESRQCSIPNNLVPSVKGSKSIQQYDHNKILELTMKLFHRVVDVSKPFHLTLLGLAFTKFQEEKSSGKSSITSFLRKQVAVQSIMDINSEENFSSNDNMESPNSEYCNEKSDMESDSEIKFKNLDEIREKFNGEEDEDLLSEVEPSPKKTKLEVWLSGRRESPSIEMADLRLNTPSSSPISKTLLQNAPTNFKTTIPIDLDKQINNHSWPNNTNNKSSNDIIKYFITNK